MNFSCFVKILNLFFLLWTLFLLVLDYFSLLRPHTATTTFTLSTRILHFYNPIFQLSSPLDYPSGSGPLKQLSSPLKQPSSHQKSPVAYQRGPIALHPTSVQTSTRSGIISRSSSRLRMTLRITVLTVTMTFKISFSWCKKEIYFSSFVKIQILYHSFLDSISISFR